MSMTSWKNPRVEMRNDLFSLSVCLTFLKCFLFVDLELGWSWLIVLTMALVHPLLLQSFFFFSRCHVPFLLPLFFLTHSKTRLDNSLWKTRTGRRSDKLEEADLHHLWWDEMAPSANARWRRRKVIGGYEVHWRLKACVQFDLTWIFWLRSSFLLLHRALFKRTTTVNCVTTV